MAGVGILAARALSYYRTVPESPSSPLAYVLLTHAFLVLLLFACAVHAAVVVLFNGTTVSVAPGRIIVRQGPIPPSETISIRVSEILGLSVRDEPRLMPPSGRRWNVVGELANGTHITLVGGFATEIAARSAARKLADHCGVEIH